MADVKPIAAMSLSGLKCDQKMCNMYKRFNLDKWIDENCDVHDANKRLYHHMEEKEHKDIGNLLKARKREESYIKKRFARDLFHRAKRALKKRI